MAAFFYLQTLTFASLLGAAAALDYAIVDTNQQKFFGNRNELPSAPGSSGDLFYGQDAQFKANPPSYVNNGDGTVSDLVTGLMWTEDYAGRMSWSDAIASSSGVSTGGYSDWRIPSIQELYSLMDFQGTDISNEMMNSVLSEGAIPFIDTNYFKFEYGGNSEYRQIDVQFVTTAEYVDADFVSMPRWFGVNFADGRIKGYDNRQPKFFVRYVRGQTNYGMSNLKDNGDGTVSDAATGLMWMQQDSLDGMDWSAALLWCENSAVGGYDDWHLPNAKELHSIVDYTRGPVTTGSAAIDPIFGITSIINEGGEEDWPYFWTSTTHKVSTGNAVGSNANYICFGRCLGYFQNQWQDVHGAGAQRSEFKTGDPSQFPTGLGPQGDAVRLYNYVRCVRNEAGTDRGVNIDIDSESNQEQEQEQDAGVETIMSSSSRSLFRSWAVLMTLLSSFLFLL